MYATLNEEAVVFGESTSLVGIVTPSGSAEAEPSQTGVILLNPGIVHRVGAGRIYVKVARALASRGFTALRFDFSGIGDSPVRHDNLQFSKSAIAETRSAMDFLAQTRGIEQFILLGGCSGAKIAFDTACSDIRVLGALLINFPSTEGEDESAAENGQRSAFAYYRRLALFDLRSWARLFTGKARYAQIVSTLLHEMKRRMCASEANSTQAEQFRLHLRALVDRNVQLTFICSEGDHRLDDLKQTGGRSLKELLAGRRVALDIIRRSDHTFSSLSDQRRLMQVLLRRAEAMVQRTIELRNPSSVTATSSVLPQLQS